MRFYLFSFFLPFPKSSQSGPELHFELIVEVINIKMGDLPGKKAQYFEEIIATAELKPAQVFMGTIRFLSETSFTKTHMSLASASSLHLCQGPSSTQTLNVSEFRLRELWQDESYCSCVSAMFESELDRTFIRRVTTSLY